MKLLRSMLAAVLAAAALLASAQQAPFMPIGTTNVAVTGTAQTLTMPNLAGATRQMVFTNVGTQTVFFVCDGTNSASPTTATASNGMPIMANSQFVTTLNNAIVSCSVIAAGTGSTLYATSGFGQ
jgi:hypothetical protein